MYRKLNKYNKKTVPWPLWLSWLEHHPVNWNAKRLIPGQGTSLGWGFGSRLGCKQRTTNWCLSHRCFSPSLFFPSPLSKLMCMSLRKNLKRKQASKLLTILEKTKSGVPIEKWLLSTWYGSGVNSFCLIKIRKHNIHLVKIPFLYNGRMEGQEYTPISGGWSDERQMTDTSVSPGTPRAAYSHPKLGRWHGTVMEQFLLGASRNTNPAKPTFQMPSLQPWERSHWFVWSHPACLQALLRLSRPWGHTPSGTGLLSRPSRPTIVLLLPEQTLPLTPESHPLMFQQHVQKGEELLAI